MKRMKWPILAMTVVLALGLTVMAMAATDTSDVTVTINVVDALTVTDAAAAIVLDEPTWSGSDNSATLDYTHNSATNKKITAQVLSGDMPAGTQDITLTVEVQDGAGQQTIVSGGTEQTAQTVYTGIAAGTLSSKTVTYTASATAAGSRAGSYLFTVTFTSSDV